MLAAPGVVEVHSRNIAYGCYMFAVTPSADPPRRLPGTPPLARRPRMAGGSVPPRRLHLGKYRYASQGGPDPATSTPRSTRPARAGCVTSTSACEDAPVPPADGDRCAGRGPEPVPGPDPGRHDQPARSRDGRGGAAPGPPRSGRCRLRAGGPRPRPGQPGRAAPGLRRRPLAGLRRATSTWCRPTRATGPTRRSTLSSTTTATSTAAAPWT